MKIALSTDLVYSCFHYCRAHLNMPLKHGFVILVSACLVWATFVCQRASLLTCKIISVLNSSWIALASPYVIKHSTRSTADSLLISRPNIQWNIQIQYTKKLQHTMKLLSELFLFCLVSLSEQHARLMEPPSRASMWRVGFPTPKVMMVKMEVSPKIWSP